MKNSDKKLLLSLLLVFLQASFQSFAASPEYRLSLTGYGPVRIGMTVKQASVALGVPVSRLKVTHPEHLDPMCYTAFVKGSQQSPVSFMVTSHHISRIDVSHSLIKSVSGAQIGMSEADIKRLYPGIQITPHKYNPKGHYLIYHSQSKPYQGHQMIFETDGQKVTRFRAGKAEQVSWVEGCS